MEPPVSDWQPGRWNAITDVPGIRVGHWTDRRGATGCTVIRCEAALSAAVDARGGAPGTRETDVLAGPNLVRTAHAICLSGGSAFGLAAATGVVRRLEEEAIGFDTAAGRVPIVPAAVIFDLAIGRAGARPGDEEGYVATARSRKGRVAEGSVGAGTGATVAKLLGNEGRLKGGVGTASIVGPRGIIVGALVVCNAVGNILDPGSGRLIAGPLAGGRVLGLAEVLARRGEAVDALVAPAAENTTLVVVATNAALPHDRLQRLAYQAHDGLARVINPCHTSGDGDVSFALSMGGVETQADDGLVAGILVVEAVARATMRSVLLAESLAGVPAASEFTVV